MINEFRITILSLRYRHFPRTPIISINGAVCRKRTVTLTRCTSNLLRSRLLVYLSLAHINIHEDRCAIGATQLAADNCSVPYNNRHGGPKKQFSVNVVGVIYKREREGKAPPALLFTPPPRRSAVVINSVMEVKLSAGSLLQNVTWSG